MLTSSKREPQEPIKRGLEEKNYGRSTADLSRFRCAKKLHRRGPLSSTLRELDMQVQGLSESNQTST